MRRWFSYLKILEKQSNSGEISLQLGLWHLENNEWGQAIQLFENSLEKGNLDDPNIAYSMLAKCYRMLGHEALAAKWQAASPY